ncbi:LapA family protein [Saccharobesus litoralis]|uniref:LapA family protein n=1 Tax=Saccharobesus litoralis TaxID=2172099 RepID=UPI00131F03D2|nr:lipopolysaccharide assembly protein LapA domain-containing protein [Saccharobesus litoralis]
MKTLKALFAFILIFLVVAISLALSSHNTQLIKLNFIIAEKTLVFSQVLAIFFFVGVVLSSLAWWWLLAKSKLKNFQQKRKIDSLTQENERLRIQLKDQ